MANCLNWDGESWLDFADWLKDQFGIEIPDEDLPAITDVGDLYDAVMLHLPVHANNHKCASAIAFYRLRRALTDLRRPVTLSPTTPLSSADPARLRQALDGLEGGLHVPRAPYGRLQCWITMAAFYSALIFVVFGVIALMSKDDVPLAALAALLSVSVSGFYLLRLFPERAPTGCVSVGDLAKAIASYNYGTFVKRGARLTDGEVWDAMCAALAELASISQGEITRDTTFLKIPAKKAA